MFRRLLSEAVRQATEAMLETSSVGPPPRRFPQRLPPLEREPRIPEDPGAERERAERRRSPAEAPARMTARDELVRLLSSRTGRRQAILMGEILGPPRALRGVGEGDQERP